MIVTMQPSRLSGIIQAPASKSSMQRACAAALLAGGETIIRNPGHSNDDKASLSVIASLGATVESLSDGSLKITSNGIDPFATKVNCGESGLGIRMLTPLIALSGQEISIEGEGSLLNRPMDFFDEIFPQLGVTVRSNAGKLPLIVRGPLQPRDIEIDGSLSSQFLTGLLMAYAAAGASGVSIKVRDLKSRPYVDLTLRVMKEFGLAVPENRDYQEFFFTSTSRQTSGGSRTYKVEGDWSGASFLLAAGAIAGPLVVRGLDPLSAQADKAMLQALESANAGFSVNSDKIEIRPTDLRGFHFDATDCPDLFPPLVALAAYCHGTTTIEGAGRLTHKESDRAMTLRAEFAKMGVRIEVQEDIMRVHGGGRIKGATVQSRHDHRIAMSCAIASLGADGPTVIEDAEAVDKSYPDFFDDMQSLGAKLKIMQLS
jgi:3-phosphoshikimate 1-carboxyvinyltransferase